MILNISEILSWMQKNGQSVLLSWGEDDSHWECSYIDGKGDRHTAFNKSFDEAIKDCMKMAQRLKVIEK